MTADTAPITAAETIKLIDDDTVRRMLSADPGRPAATLTPRATALRGAPFG